MEQSIGKTYAQLINFGRMLKNHHHAQQVCDEYPEQVLAFVNMIDQQLRFTKVDDFFSLFPPIKRYKDDGIWDYKSTMQMRKEELGSHFGKDAFKNLIMTTCYENKYLRLVGLSFMWSISRVHENRTGRDMLEDFINTF